MREAKDNPESLPEREDQGGQLYSVPEFRREISRLRRKAARVSNLIRMAETLSSDNRVKKILTQALEVK